MSIAIFDLDYTLTKRGTWGRFVWSMIKRRPHVWVPLWASAGLTQWKYKQGKLPRVAVKQAMMRWCMVGKTKEEMLERAETFAENEVRAGLRPGGIKVLKDHKDRGDTILIASAAVDIITEAIARRLGVEHVVSTKMNWDANGRLAPDFMSKNCYGPEKLRRVQTYLTENGLLKQNHTDITMYSDSYSDLEILTFADLSVAVHPDKRLKNHAEQQGWPIENWD